MGELDPLKRGAGDISFVAADVDGLVGLGPASDGDHAPGETVDIASICAPGEARRDPDEPAGGRDGARRSGSRFRSGKLCPYRHLCARGAGGINHAQWPRLHRAAPGRDFAMTNSRLFAAPLLAATALTFAAPAAAQRVDRIVAFGDSYADDGNFFQIRRHQPGHRDPASIRPAASRAAPTISTRLAQLLDAPVDNFAIGGALTDNTQHQRPGCPASSPNGTAFLAGGGRPPSRRVSGTFDENDLLTVSIGGNDARFYQQTGGTLAGAPAAATASAAFATAGLNALVAAGAQNISFLAGNTALLPEVAGQSRRPQAIRNAFSTTFNTAMQSTLAGYAANGVIVHYLDLTLIGDNVIANPAAYGLTSAGACPALPDATLHRRLRHANSFLFYVDQLHLTSAGFAIVARNIRRAADRAADAAGAERHRRSTPPTSSAAR